MEVKPHRLEHSQLICCEVKYCCNTELGEYAKHQWLLFCYNKWSLLVLLLAYTNKLFTVCSISCFVNSSIDEWMVFCKGLAVKETRNAQTPGMYSMKMESTWPSSSLPRYCTIRGCCNVWRTLISSLRAFTSYNQQLHIIAICLTYIPCTVYYSGAHKSITCTRLAL